MTGLTSPSTLKKARKVPRRRRSIFRPPSSRSRMLKKIGSAGALDVRDRREIRDMGKSNFHPVSPVPSVLLANIVFPQPARRCFMPMYDYKCLDCGKESLVVLTLKEHESSKVKCPKCGSTKMQQLYSSFVAHTTKKS